MGQSLRYIESVSVVQAAMAASIILHRKRDRLYRTLHSFLSEHNAKPVKWTRRMVPKLQAAVEAQFPDLPHLSVSTGSPDPAIGRTGYTLQLAVYNFHLESSETERFQLYLDLDYRVDLERSFLSERNHAAYAAALQAKMPQVPEKVEQFNAALKVLADLADFAMADVREGPLKHHPLHPLSDFFKWYEMPPR